ncbi:Hint domain-containing protein [Cellulomonas xiejunii]|uniref:Hint domain-containing protein n=1 Tax=Cellulomonas xiejunii TaxID=2968083 RepID=A0ABY5KRX2_9CELL|nr:Hint domain-containing protein [Cellulomonas xiejunii]MCC2320807.1 Hint domain-containing protein [Cellulomonas xiejunii]UUI71093.1 Hint domain-containing protein [Cellulomonas xiejunii]
MTQRAAAKKAVAEAEAFVAQIGDEIVGLVLDLIGFTDAKKCISEGDVGACISTALNAVPWGKMFKAAKVAIKAIGVGKRLVEGYSKLKAASKALADIPKWNPEVVPDAAALKQANAAAEQAKAAANQSRTVASRTSREVDDAKRANDQARKAAENKKADTCNSFVPGTGVVMGDGSVKAVDDVAVGDTVVAVAADGTRTHRQVVATITGHGAKDLVGLTLVGSGGGGPPAAETITATDGHLFLTADGAWVPAKDLQVGDRLVDPDGTPVTIGAVERDSVVATVHNLTVDTDHTYTVVTGAGTDVVTHNDNLLDAVDGAQKANACPVSGSGRVVGKADDPLVPGLIDDIEARYPGHVTGQGVNVHRADGSVLTDFDIVTRNAVIQVKSGSGKGALKQMLATQSATGLPVIAYLPQARGSVIKALESAGMMVTRDKSMLLDVIRP